LIDKIDPEKITDEEFEALDFFDQVWIRNYRQAKADLKELAEKRKHRKPRKKQLKNTCPQCGKKFLTVLEDKIFCSKICEEINLRKKEN